MTREIIGMKIKAAREMRNISQGELATKLHVSQGAISSWETGRTAPDVELLPLIAEVLGVDLLYLYGKDVTDFSQNTMKFPIKEIEPIYFEKSDIDKNRYARISEYYSRLAKLNSDSFDMVAALIDQLTKEGKKD